MNNLKIIRAAIVVILVCNTLYSQNLNLHKPTLDLKYSPNKLNSPVDSVKKTERRKFRSAGIFVNVGTGLQVPMNNFSTNSNATFGILGRLEIGATAIYPFVIGGEISYFSYIPNDQFKTLNVISTFRTKIVSYGLNIDYSLAKLFNSPYTIPFVTLDVKSNKIKRDLDPGVTLAGLPASESKISFGAGVGVTLFVFDFYIKYNYMKDLVNFGAYAKIRFSLIRF